jgi:hypothetical protein
VCNKFSGVWKDAVEDLDLEIVCPFNFVLPNGRALEPLFLLKNFGAANGMLIFGDFGDISSVVEDISCAGYGFSVLDDPFGEGVYSREDFIEMLSDWGWSGPKELAPNWLS